ncbi:ceramide synthase 1 LOH3-like [Rosa rugosa]|uniref:ceramide synthase 1 LOH3-like n=1 Tax=Rosa rugosa TaxID=74645 RepID=UPI002B41714A|nr:ceramide synthase 1 LOH3-like [Rosa rugosa]XP_062026468.1 ceramide synthase 1 LOH3-like [Rosa rugosa]XP_062026469.1 ceramide synthase 1 LOH3-like [Rosa rugosa]XP_062026470.1 ceramide synthase 1 LOH3-like [Rosa rugosa]
MDSGLSDWVKYLEEESYPVPRDFLVLPLFVLLFPTLRLFLDKFVFERLARWLIFGKGQKKVETHDERKKITKFKESAWKCLYFFSAEALAVSITYNEPWFSKTKNFWVGPGDQVWPDQKTKLKLKALYMYSAGFYMYSSFALVFWETRRSDFWVSMAHHVATTILIVFSYTARFSRVGSIILALHEGSDVFLEIAKLSKYCGLELIASVSFVMFVLSWTVLRLIYFPFWIIWSTCYESLLNLDKEKHMVDGSIYYYLFNTLLICLLILHIYWWKLMVWMLIKQIRSWGKLDDDVRSDSEGDDDEHDD